MSEREIRAIEIEKHLIEIKKFENRLGLLETNYLSKEFLKICFFRCFTQYDFDLLIGNEMSRL